MSDEVDEDRELVPFEELEGAFVTLKRAGPTQKLADHFAKNGDMRDIIGHVESVPDLERLAMLMEDDESLWAWEIERNGRQLGYCFFVTYDGPPFVAIYTFQPVDVEIGKDCLEQLVPIFFANTDEEALYYYLPRPVDDGVHEALIDGGFDPWDDNPTIDNDAVACYMLERHTFDAYYGDGTDEEFEESGEMDPYDSEDE